MMVSSLTFENELHSGCTFDVKFADDEIENNPPNVSCFQTCTNDSTMEWPASKRQSFFYHGYEATKKYNGMVEITVGQDGTLKCILEPANTTHTEENTNIQEVAKEIYLVPEKLVFRSHANCPEHYDYVKDINTCIRFSDDELSWADASKACEAGGGTLVIVDSKEKHEAFNSAAGLRLLPNIAIPTDKHGLYLWIGLSDINIEGKFDWVDGSLLNYSSWFPNEPNNAKNKEHCVVIVFMKNSSLWKDKLCQSKHRYVCESRPKESFEKFSATPNFSAATLDPSTTILPLEASSGLLTIHICPAGWWKSNTTEVCYYIGEDERTFEQSKYYCQSIGGTLASVPNSSEMQYIQELMVTNDIINLWIGLTDKSLEGTFEWIDGSPLNYRSWADNQPDDWMDNEDCVAIDQSRGYLWIDRSCKIKVKQLCMIKPDKLAIKHCASENLVIRHVDENVLEDDLICPTQSTTSLVCLQKDGGDGTREDNQFLLPLVIVSALLGLHFLGLISVSFYFCKFYKMQKMRDQYAKTVETNSGNLNRGEVNLAHFGTPKGKQVQDEKNYDENNIYDGPENDTEKYGYYINPRVK